MKSTTNEILKYLKTLRNKNNLKGMARYGINTSNAFGVNIPILRNVAKEHKKNHELALELWDTAFHEARLLAVFIDNPEKVTNSQMEKWVKDFNSWDLCDQCCSNLFDKTPFAYEKALKWSKSKHEFVKRAGFVMMATLSVHDKKVEDNEFIKFLKIIENEAKDDRNFVKKAVNWALRQIGKRNLMLHKYALSSAKKIYQQPYKSSKWIASDAIRELMNDKIISRIKSK